jgi:hypothetical protein
MFDLGSQLLKGGVLLLAPTFTSFSDFLLFDLIGDVVVW